MTKREQDPRILGVHDRWTVHSYYSLCPYAPDGSGRIIVSGADLEKETAAVFVLDSDGRVLAKSPEVRYDVPFFHTGLWQTWSPDSRHVYFQSIVAGTPTIVRWTPETAKTSETPGELEGAPPSGEPVLCAKLGMLYAAGHGDHHYHPEAAPVPFQDRERHGLFEVSFDPPQEKLLLSVSDFLERHPRRDEILKADAESRRVNGDGLTLMLYCVRWSPDGQRFLFYFGNHSAPSTAERTEPKLSSVFTSDRSLRDIRFAVDLSFGRRGVHWSWQPDNESLIGYGPDPADSSRMCLAEVRFDGSGYRKISDHASGGHPSISPKDPNIVVTDSYGPVGHFEVIEKKSGATVGSADYPLHSRETIPPGRSRYRVDLHPAFHPSGERVIVNVMRSNGLSQVAEITVDIGAEK
ncbi:MAG: hypothetical protein EA426_16995 [Spirochaetaceae bacterium]|nr:MAG: hypothetical protein EA426_16995 [Spirochaetaceae bacterium]